MSNILTVVTSPVRGAIEWLREEWQDDKTSFWLLLSSFVLLAIMSLLLIVTIVGGILALTGVIPAGAGGGDGTTPYIPHPVIIVPHVYVP